MVVLTFLLVDFNQCQPLDWFWNKLKQGSTVSGRCININTMVWSHAAINIVLDLWLLAVPATQVLRLQMALGKKVQVLSLFALGAL